MYADSDEENDDLPPEDKWIVNSQSNLLYNFKRGSGYRYHNCDGSTYRRHTDGRSLYIDPDGNKTYTDSSGRRLRIDINGNEQYTPPALIQEEEESKENITRELAFGKWVEEEEEKQRISHNKVKREDHEVARIEVPHYEAEVQHDDALAERPVAAAQIKEEVLDPEIVQGEGPAHPPRDLTPERPEIRGESHLDHQIKDEVMEPESSPERAPTPQPLHVPKLTLARQGFGVQMKLGNQVISGRITKPISRVPIKAEEVEFALNRLGQSSSAS